MHFLDWMRRKFAHMYGHIWMPVPPPPFKASKKVAIIMYGVWYGRFTPMEAKAKAAKLGFTPEQADDMIARATRPEFQKRGFPSDCGQGLIESEEVGTALWRHEFGLSRAARLLILTAEEPEPTFIFNANVVTKDGVDLTSKIIESHILDGIAVVHSNKEYV